MTAYIDFMYIILPSNTQLFWIRLSKINTFPLELCMTYTKLNITICSCDTVRLYYINYAWWINTDITLR